MMLIGFVLGSGGRQIGLAGSSGGKNRAALDWGG
jgi:hypothetical protein